MSSRPFANQERHLRTLYGANFVNFEQHRVDGPGVFYIVCLARLVGESQRLWGTTLVSIYRGGHKGVNITLDDRGVVTGYQRARAVFEACVTKGVNYVVTLIHGDQDRAIDAAIAEFGHLFIPQEPTVEDLPQTEPEVRLRSFTFGTAQPAAEGDPPPVPASTPVARTIHVDHRWGEVEHNHNNPVVDQFVFENITVVIWMSPDKIGDEAIFRYYATDDDGEYLFAFNPWLWPQKPTIEAVRSWLKELQIAT